MSKRPFIPIATAMLAAFGLPACGGGGDDEPAIKKAVQRAITTKDATLKCEQLVTKSFVTRVYGSAAQCLTAERPSSGDQPPTGVTTSDVKVDGDSATVKIRVSGSDADGASGTIDLRKEGGDWRVEDLGVDYLRSQVQKGLAGSGSAESGALRDPKIRECAGQAFMRLGDTELRRVAYLAIAETDAGKAQLTKLLAPCLTKASNSSGSISFLRRKFESGITSSARKDGLPQSAIDCVNKQLRSSISDDEIAKLAFNGGKATTAMKRSSAEALGRCQGRTATNGATALRQLFERGVRQGAANRGVSKQAVSCVIRRLRRSITDDEIVGAISSERTKAKLTRRTAAELVACGR